jgi:type IV secretory pathway TrbF-like protein
VAVHVVEVDTLGAVRTVQSAETVYVPTDAAIMKQLGDFIKYVRGLGTDPVEAGERIRLAEGMVTPRAGELLQSVFDANPPKARFGVEATKIDILRTLRTKGDMSWDVTWREETVKLPNYTDRRSVVITGLFTLVIRQPKNDYEVKVNPLGIWIDHFAIEHPAQ